MRKITVHNPNNLPIIDYRKLRVLQGDLKVLSEENLRKLCDSILKHGYFVPAFVWRSGDLWILDATQRYHALEALEKQDYIIPEIPYIEIEAKDKKDAAEKLLQITSRYGTINEDTTFFEDFNIDLEFINEIEIPELDIKLDDNTEIEEDEVPEPPAEPISKTGELWLCGRHRVLCGDSTEQEDVQRLMDGKKVDMCFCDPPYGMNKGIANDEKELDELMKWNQEWITVMNTHIHENAFFIVWHSNKGYWTVLIPALKEWNHVRTFPMYKPNDVAFPWQSWICKTELALMFKRGNPKYNIVKPYAHDTYVWNHPGKYEPLLGDAEKGCVHPTIKPRTVITDLLSRLNGDVIYDAFLGSGTTLIAAEQLNRICYGCEIDPHYIDVILDRYAKFTGNDPIREDGVKWSELKKNKGHNGHENQT